MERDKQPLLTPSLIWILGTVSVVLLPVLFRLPIWLWLLALGSIFVRALIIRERIGFPPRWIRVILSIACTLAVIISLAGGAALSGTVGLLVAGFSLKLLELQHRRDALFILYVAYLVSASALLFDQSILSGLYMLLAFWITSSALVSLYAGSGGQGVELVKTSGRILLHAVPLMLVLFIVVPRISPLWQVRLATGGQFTGLSESMSPGDISRLTRDSSVAFRASFEGVSPPPQNALYWRAMTFGHFDGSNWSVGEELHKISSQSGSRFAQQDGAQSYTYNVIMEPSGQNYLPMLEFPKQISTDMQLLSDFSVRHRYAVEQKMGYQGSSYLSNLLPNQVKPLTFEERLFYLQIPQGNPRSRALAASWQGEQDITKLMSFFNQNFYYTLEPPTLNGDSIDGFLFDTQQGFCGHFAGATVFLLRAAGIPARVVAGYQGGEWNPVEQYLIVRQYDAHAWVEYWREGVGWQRLDPTAAVSPERIMQSADSLFREQPDFLSDQLFAVSRFATDSLLAELRMRWDAVNFVWQRWVLNYHNQQSDLLRSLLGELTALRLALAFLIPMLCIVGWISFQLLRSSQRQRHYDALDQQLVKLSLKLEKKGLARKSGETISDYLVRLSSLYPEQQQQLNDLARQYQQLRYASETEDDNPQLIKSLTERLKLLSRSL